MYYKPDPKKLQKAQNDCRKQCISIISFKAWVSNKLQTTMYNTERKNYITCSKLNGGQMKAVSSWTCSEVNPEVWASETHSEDAEGYVWAWARTEPRFASLTPPPASRQPAETLS